MANGHQILNGQSKPVEASVANAEAENSSDSVGKISVKSIESLQLTCNNEPTENDDIGKNGTAAEDKLLAPSGISNGTFEDAEHVACPESVAQEDRTSKASSQSKRRKGM